MTRDDVTRLWQQSMNDAEGMRLGYSTQQHYFAALVAAAEREACAKVCDIYALANSESDIMADAFNHCSAAIRARGEK